MLYAFHFDGSREIRREKIHRRQHTKMHPFTRERMEQEAAFAKAEEEERAREAAEAAEAAALKAATAARDAAPQTAPTAASASELLSAAELREKRLAYFDTKTASQPPKRRRGARELRSLETAASLAPARCTRLRHT